MAKKKAKKPAKKAGKKKPAKKAAKRPAKKAAKKTSKKKPAKKAAKKPAKKASKKPAAPAVKPTTSVNPYVNFNGNCEEAFNFYQSIFGGKFGYVGRFGEMPPQEGQPPLPAEAANKIMHISLPISKETSLMGSDALEGFGPPMVVGTNFAVSINAVSKADADRLFNGLSAGGRVDMPIGDTFWGSYFGMFADKFGINWMVSFDAKSSK